MKTGALIVIASLGLASAAAAQQAAPDGGRVQRAPLSVPDDLAPAVDVSRPATGQSRPAAADGSAVAGEPAGAATAAPASAQPARAAGARTTTIDTLDLGTTSITGNQELPKVLYIVPWKSSDLGDLAGRPVNTLLDEVLAPIDPEVFERQLEYFESLYGTTVKE